MSKLTPKAADAWAQARARNCPRCDGRGRYLYPNTATYKSVPGTISGQAMTEDVCNICWGSGDALKPDSPPEDAPLVYHSNPLMRDL